MKQFNAADPIKTGKWLNEQREFGEARYNVAVVEIIDVVNQHRDSAEAARKRGDEPLAEWNELMADDYETKYESGKAVLRRYGLER